MWRGVTGDLAHQLGFDLIAEHPASRGFVTCTGLERGNGVGVEEQDRALGIEDLAQPMQRRQGLLLSHGPIAAGFVPLKRAFAAGLQQTTTMEPQSAELRAGSTQSWGKGVRVRTSPTRTPYTSGSGRRSRCVSWSRRDLLLGVANQ